MSKLIDKLQRAGQESPPPLGFGAAARSGEGTPSIILIGVATQEELAKDPSLLETGTDAVTVSLDPWDDASLESAVESLKDRLWGVRASGLDREKAETLKSKGCDFIVFNPDDTDASVLNDYDLGKIVAIEPGLEEDTGHAIRELPIEGALLSLHDDSFPLTVTRLMEIQRVQMLVGKPLVIAATATLDASGLEVFRNTGTAGLFVCLSSRGGIREMRDAIASLPRRRPRPVSRSGIVPQVSSGIGMDDSFSLRSNNCRGGILS